MLVNEGMRGKLDLERYHKIINNLLNSLKQAFDKDQRKTFGLLLTLTKEKKENIRILLSFTSNKKYNLKALI